LCNQQRSSRKSRSIIEKHDIDGLSDAITGGKDIGLWSSNIPEKNAGIIG